MPGGPEIVVIMLLALIVLGPEQLPKAMRTFGNVMAEIRKVSSAFQSEMRSAMDSIETTVKPSSGSTAPSEPSAPDAPSIEATATESSTGSEDSPPEGSSPEAEPADHPDQATSGAEAKPAISPADRAAG